MTPPPDHRDASAYADGDPDAVRAARPPEPSEAVWEQMRNRIHARVTARAEPARPQYAHRVGIIAALTAVAAVVAWVAFGLLTPKPPTAPEVVHEKLVTPEVPPPDPLADFDVLPMASAEEVVLHRVPGDGWLPVGAHPLPGEIVLATSVEVALDDPNPAWPTVAPTPGHAPMVFAAKPR